MQFKTRDDGTLEFSASPSELVNFADMVRDAALYGESQTGTLMDAGGVTPAGEHRGRQSSLREEHRPLLVFVAHNGERTGVEPRTAISDVADASAPAREPMEPIDAPRGSGTNGDRQRDRRSSRQSRSAVVRRSRSRVGRPPGAWVDAGSAPPFRDERASHVTPGRVPLAL